MAVEGRTAPFEQRSVQDECIGSLTDRRRNCGSKAPKPFHELREFEGNFHVFRRSRARGFVTGSDKSHLFQGASFSLSLRTYTLYSFCQGERPLKRSNRAHAKPPATGVASWDELS